MTLEQSEIEHVLGLERDLQSPAVRGDVRRLRRLLANDFIEIGASGRRWDLVTILDLLAQEANPPPMRWVDVVPAPTPVRA